jgi:hypothetical protein
MAQTNRMCFRIIIEQRKGITIVDKKGLHYQLVAP